MSGKYDVIVVGAGPGGVTCGALLAKLGLNTLVLDKNSQVGGKAMTLSKRGFRYEYYPIWPCPGADSQIHAALKALGLEEQVELIQPDPFGLMHYETPLGEIRTMVMRGPGHPTDQQELFGLLGVKETEMEEVLRLFGEIVLMSPQDRDLLDDVSTLEFLDRYNIPRSVYSFIATLQSEGTIEVPGDVACASEVVKIFQQLITGGSGCYPAGGLGAMYEAIAGAARANGGDIRLETKVDRIVVQNGRVSGVHTEKGDFYAPIVVSNAGIQPTVLKLVGEEHFDRSYVNYVRDLVPSLGFAGARYILSKPVLEYPVYIYFSDNTVSTTDHILEEESGQMPEQIYVFVSTNSLFPGMAPPGKQLVHTGISCPADPKVDPKTWMDKVEAEVARIWPDVVEHIEEREYYGSAHISALSRDSVVPGTGGECIGLGQIVGQCGRHKPSAKAPVGGLFYVGADAGSTGFFANNLAVASGLNVAKTVLQYFKTHPVRSV
ncbi:MAG TPA: NAD(P)/FAD-dependent oxidoreductase [Dehalococcoidia bacterium]|nr:NAD(P)/FAD-dependent oxidoreductase [Dehalococcoidia bacterium]